MSKRLTFEIVNERFSNDVKRLMRTLHFTLSERVVRCNIEELDHLILVHKSYKYQATERGDAFYADCFFYMQCVLSSIRALYLVFEKVRSNENNAAWGALIDAYEYIDIAAKAGKQTKVPPGEDGVLGTTKIRDNIESIELALFPSHGKYNSPAFVESIGECSVCKKSFVECEHVEGEIYMGTLCRRINRALLDVEHFALVDNPRDRRCIFTSRHDEAGNAIDCFTGEPLIEELDQSTYQGILFYMGELDLH